MANAIANNTKFQHSREGRLGCLMMGGIRWMFQFTPLMRGATLATYLDATITEVSIHAPHARGDRFLYIPLLGRQGFNSRPSCEGRPCRKKNLPNWPWFQVTPLMRGATRKSKYGKTAYGVSIHAPHARGDHSRRQAVFQFLRFNSRPSCEGRRDM